MFGSHGWLKIRVTCLDKKCVRVKEIYRDNQGPAETFTKHIPKKMCEVTTLWRDVVALAWTSWCI